MNNEEWVVYKNDKFNEIPRDVLVKAVEVTKTLIAEDASMLKMSIDADPIHWIGMEHHGWGMWFRNQLRQNELTDDMLPDGNWDDYYCQVIECALGYRDIPEEV